MCPNCAIRYSRWLTSEAQLSQSGFPWGYEDRRGWCKHNFCCLLFHHHWHQYMQTVWNYSQAKLSFHPLISKPILAWLVIIKPDIHLDGPYDIGDTLDAAKFTLSQLAFHSLSLSQTAPAFSFTFHSSSSPILLLSSSSYASTNIPCPVYVSTNPSNTSPIMDINQANLSTIFLDSLDNPDILGIESEVFTSDSDSDSDSNLDSDPDSDSDTKNISSPDLDFQLYLVDVYQIYQMNHLKAISLPAHSNPTGSTSISPHPNPIPSLLEQITHIFSSSSLFSMSSNLFICGPI